MQRDVDREILDVDGDPLVEPHKGGERVGTVRSYVVQALAMGNGQQVSGEEKIARYKLAMQIQEGGTLELTPENLATIKAAVAAVYPPLIVGQVYQWADE